MTATMQALVFLGLGKAGVIEKPLPKAGPTDAVVRTTSALICTSDVHTVRGGIPVPEGRGLGHESVGVIHELGSAVTGFSVGQRVAVAATTPCFHCGPCQRGFSSQCQGMLGAYKFTAQRDGNMAEYFLVNDAAANLAVIPDGLSDEKAVYATDMLSTGFSGAENAQLRLGESVAIFAQGPIGLSATIGCRLLGAGLIIAVEGRPERQELARRFGADLIVDPGSGDVVGRILELTGGIEVDAAIEALGSPVTFEAALRVTKPGGRISNIGYHGEVPEPLQIPLDAFGLGMSDKKILTSLCPGGSDRLDRIFRLIRSGRVDPTPMTTHQFGFDEVERAFSLMESKRDGIIKPLIRFA
ncbi:NAD(P)-dependent alcohol dehydrogenase [Frankia sp. Mgl5]|uniref:NAD(P)-dependent alcohol dehydrogenase n=1 Tax=Frankia sp. Mgl5 TaxID=2933793 RepID=UPI00200BB4F0|nr:NAD(P)-dependent alcohol dehydrogenase [Frankia sp. Mgl5]MCK9930581.1 NAD(P)-dependent alcohol dehydrogenase [Frankia sp. Mgl5]